MLSLPPVARSFFTLAAACAGLIATSANSQPVAAPENGLTLRGTAQFGVEGPVVWSLAAAHVADRTLLLQLRDLNGAPAGDLTVSSWPHKKGQKGGLAVGLPNRRIPPDTVSVTGTRTLQPFGAVQRLVVQQRSAKLPALVIQTRGRSGQSVAPGWRAVYADNRWSIQPESAPTGSATGALPAATPRDALVPQRLRSQGQDWCLTSFARAESQEAPPLLDWVLVAAPAKRRCAA